MNGGNYKYATIKSVSRPKHELGFHLQYGTWTYIMMKVVQLLLLFSKMKRRTIKIMKQISLFGKLVIGNLISRRKKIIFKNIYFLNIRVYHYLLGHHAVTDKLVTTFQSVLSNGWGLTLNAWDARPLLQRFHHWSK